LSYIFPPGFIESISSAGGFEKDDFIIAHEKMQAPVSIRLNPFKQTDSSDLSFDLRSKVPWSEHGYYLNSRPSFTLDPLFHGGAYYVQEASSMFLEYAIRQTVDLRYPVIVLDCCAAPGGKSTLIQSVLSHDSLLVSNEVIKARSAILVENITKWGAPNVIVTNNDPSHFQKLPEFFDLLVVDAPCSGSGLFRKDPSAMKEWSEASVEHCSQRQQRILTDSLPALKENGILIYSTCSYSEKENECIADWLIAEQGMEALKLSLDPSWEIFETHTSNGGFGYRFYPGKTEGEGFFISCFRKMNNSGFGSKDPSVKLNFVSRTEKDLVQSSLENPGDFEFIRFNDDVIAIPLTHVDSYKHITSNLYLKKAFLNIGSLGRKELIPSHEWAISTVRSAHIPEITLSLEDALQYLRKQDFRIASDARGWAVMMYKNISLGLAKLLGNRINNYYPKEWRILNK